MICRISVGANEFRNRFGWYMERAARGEEIAVTRWGKPYVKLVPAAPHQPELPPGEENEVAPASSRA